MGVFAGGVLSPMVLVLLVLVLVLLVLVLHLLSLLLRLLLMLSPPSSGTLTQPVRRGSEPPPTPARLPPTQPVKPREGHVGVIPQHPDQLRDPH